jgi:translation initiation factor 3 subunit C
MSKFFKGVSSSDSSDSESSNDEVVVQQQRAPTRDFGLPSDSDDDEPKRVVRAQKDKMYEDLKEQIRLARNARNIKDISKLLTSFETLIKCYEKTKNVIIRENLTVPRFYIRYLAEVEDFCNEQFADKDGIKAMSKANAKSFNSLRQKVRKYNKDFESEIASYREGADPVGYSSGEAQSDAGEAVEDDLSDAAPQQATKKKETKHKKSTADHDNESDWDSVSDSSSSGSELELEGKQMEELRQYFLKKDKPEKRTKNKEVRKNKEAKVQKEVESDEDENTEQWMKIRHKDEASKPLFDSKSEITAEIVIKKLAELSANRGKKSTNRKVYVRQLRELYDVTVEHNLGVGILPKILLSVISAMFEMNARISDVMEFSAWQKTLETIDGLFNLLAEYKNVYISIATSEEEENLTDSDKPFLINGSAILLVKRLDDELTKIFQHTDCHSTEYIEKLKGEKDLCGLISNAQSYVDSRRDSKHLDPTEVAIIYMLNIEHLYYKYLPHENETKEQMDRLCKVIYSLDNTMQQRQRAMLCQIYHHALHDRWNEAKNLMLMSHLQAIADHSDASTQVLYNRTICQLGLCAFRHGFIREAHIGLAEIQNTQRAKELLAQGIPPRQADKTPEQELKERALQVPYHMHINLELMECVYLICSMLLEIPSIAWHENDLRRKLLSRSFHYQLKFSEKSALIGPPENTREHVVAASRAMLKGDWVKCRNYIINDKMNAKVWNLFRNAEAVKEMVISRIQEETLRTYLLMYSTVYNTVSLPVLCGLFELDKKRVYSIISKMIINEELSAALDEPTDCLIMHRVEPSRLQKLALNFTDKLSQLADNNEQIIDPRSGGRTGYTGPGGNWNAGQRQQRTAEQQNADNRGGMRAGTQSNWYNNAGQRGGRAAPDKNRQVKFQPKIKSNYFS